MTSLSDRPPAGNPAHNTSDRMHVAFDVLLPVDIRSLAKLPGELARAFERAGVTCTEPVIKQDPVVVGDVPADATATAPGEAGAA